jgi:predicted secreted protein
MALVKGTDLRIYIGGTLGAGGKLLTNETTCDIELSTTMIETSSKDSGAWKTQIPGRKSWGLSATVQLDYADPTTTYTYDALLTAWLDQTELHVTFKTSTATDTTLYGQAYIESEPVKSADQTIATCDIKLVGTGVLSKGVVPGA